MQNRSPFHEMDHIKKQRTLECVVLLRIFLFPKIVPQLAADGGVAQSTERLCLDLADALARHTHFATDLFKGVSLPIQKTVA